MARPARVQGVVGTLWKVVCAADTGIDLRQPVLLKLSGLIGKPHIILSALVLSKIGIVHAVPKPDA